MAVWAGVRGCSGMPHTPLAGYRKITASSAQIQTLTAPKSADKIN